MEFLEGVAEDRSLNMGASNLKETRSGEEKLKTEGCNAIY